MADDGAGALGNELVEELLFLLGWRGGVGDDGVEHDACSAAGFAHYGDVVAGAAEEVDVCLDPGEGEALVQEAGVGGGGVGGGGEGGEVGEEAEGCELWGLGVSSGVGGGGAGLFG